MDNEHGLRDGSCLQSIAHQSHSVDADWIVKYRRAMLVKFLQCSILGFCGDTKPASFLKIYS